MDGFEVPLQLVEIIKWIGVAKVTGMNQAGKFRFNKASKGDVSHELNNK